jgi:hypothetical protein
MKYLHESLELFNGVLAKPGTSFKTSVLGLFIEPDAAWAFKRIEAYYRKIKLSNADFNKTFYNSVTELEEMSISQFLKNAIDYYERAYEQGLTYVEPDAEELGDYPLIRLLVVRGYTKDQLVEKCLGMFSSGQALEQDTIDKVLKILTKDLHYTFDGSENIRNREAAVLIADKYKVYPKDPVEMLRYLVYKATDNTLLIKNEETYEKIKKSTFNPRTHMKVYGLERLAPIFNRFKPIFLSWKGKCPSTINKLSKLSKKLHKPMVQNPLNSAASTLIHVAGKHRSFLENATPYALMRAYGFCYNVNENYGDLTGLYSIRNGKVWYRKNRMFRPGIVRSNIISLESYMQGRFESVFRDKVFLVDEGVHYGLPTSEKNFVGNVPMGTVFSSKTLAVGIHWKPGNVEDYDISALSLEGMKVGWNTRHKSGSLYFSGDLVYPPATEYLLSKGKIGPRAVFNNAYSGSIPGEYTIIVGKTDNNEELMNPDNVWVTIPTIANVRGEILGLMFTDDDDLNKFILAKRKFSKDSVLQGNENSVNSLRGYIDRWTKQMTFNEFIQRMGGFTTTDVTAKHDVDLRLHSLTKTTFTDIFEE